MSRTAFLIALLLSVQGTLASAGPPAATASWSRDSISTGVDAGVFPTVEAAVEDAFQSAAHRPGPAERGRLQYGTIRRVEGGFAWSRPVVSQVGVLSSSPIRVRLQLGPDDVAIYGVHPRSGQPEVDRLNEGLIRSERRLLDRLADGPDRPLFVLTPARRVLRYSRGPQPLALVVREAGAFSARD